MRYNDPCLEARARDYLNRARDARATYLELCEAAFNNPGLSDTLLKAARSFKEDAASWLKLAAQTRILDVRVP